MSDLSSKISVDKKVQRSMLGEDIIFVATVSCAQLLAQAGLGQSIAPLHIIGDTFGTQNAGQLSWATAAYSLTLGTFILLSGRLGDFYGYRRLFLIGCAVYTITSIAAGLCSYVRGTFIPFDVLRALQGIGPAIMLPNGLALLAEHFQERSARAKRLAFTCFGAVAPGGFVFGAVFSSIPAQRGQWPWGYYAMGIANALLAVQSYIVIHEDKKTRERSTFSNTAKTLDLTGAGIGISGLVLFNFAWNQAPLVGWQSVQAILTLCLGLALLAVFLWYERFVAKEDALLPWHEFSSDSTFVLACIAGGWSSFGVFVYYFYQQAQVIEGLGPLTVSARFVPAAFAGPCAALVTAYLLPRSRPSFIMALAMLGFLVGSILMASRQAFQIYWAQMFVATLVTPFGMDMSFPAGSIILSNAMPAHRQGLAGSLVTTFVNYSISIGLGVAGTVESYTDDNGTNRQQGIKNARWAGVALAATALCVSLIYCLLDALNARKSPGNHDINLEEA